MSILLNNLKRDGCMSPGLLSGCPNESPTDSNPTPGDGIQTNVPAGYAPVPQMLTYGEAQHGALAPYDRASGSQATCVYSSDPPAPYQLPGPFVQQAPHGNAGGPPTESCWRCGQLGVITQQPMPRSPKPSGADVPPAEPYWPQGQQGVITQQPMPTGGSPRSSRPSGPGQQESRPPGGVNWSGGQRGAYAQQPMPEEPSWAQISPRLPAPSAPPPRHCAPYGNAGKGPVKPYWSSDQQRVITQQPMPTGRSPRSSRPSGPGQQASRPAGGANRPGGYPQHPGNYPGAPMGPMAPAPPAPPPIEWMPVPKGIQNCPRGLEYLAYIDYVWVEQKMNLVEVLTGFEEANRYTVRNKNGQPIYFAVEENDCCTRNCVGSLRPFEMLIFDHFRYEVMRLNRPCRCQSCCCPCCLQSMEVAAPPGHVIGSIHQKWHVCLPKFDVKNHLGETAYHISGPCVTCSCCCKPVKFEVMSSNFDKVGEIQKDWGGFGREYFTDADTFGIKFPMDLDCRAKAGLLGASFLIDMMYFENLFG